MKSRFDPVQSPLQNGITVIEASAGTGKTTAICAIVLRLVVERAIPIENILVTTYTELATAELRGRIRNVFAEALACAAGEKKKFSPFVAPIVESVRDKSSFQQRLTSALHNFDQAPIFTIHGFCARVLSDCTFESGALFACELVADQSQLFEQIADDFCRARLYPADALTGMLLRDRLKPEHLVALLEQLASNPTLRVLPELKDLESLKKKIAGLPEEAAERESLMRDYLIALRVEFCAWAREEMRRRKASRRVQSFDDLLTQVDDALRSENGAILQRSLRARFPVALIDEFQDTDPVQYSIFSHIYGSGDGPAFFIGDPKQAIYGFRGADVFTYLKAARAATQVYTLGRNWRSEAKLVQAVNDLFRQRDDAFVLPGIELAPIGAGGEADEQALELAGKRDQPLRIWVAPKGESIMVETAVAHEIARLLGSGTIGNRRIAPRDIAVLVANNAQPAKIRNALARLGIPSVVYTAASVFKSPEAEELLTILRAIAAHTEEKRVRAALATAIFGKAAHDLEQLSQDEPAWEETLNRFAAYHEMWRDHGFVAMMRRLLATENVRGRLLQLRDGERRITNLLHLIELGHAACAENRYGMDGMIGWLETHVSGRRNPVKEEHELRLESDDAAVRIVTIHKSKGLQFGITFSPYARKELRRRPNELIKWHRGDELVLDLEGAHETEQKREQLAELAREFYVSATRARHRNYIVWPERRERSKSALAWLSSPLRSAEQFIGKGEAEVAAILQHRFAQSDAIAFEELPNREAPEAFSAREDRVEFAPRVLHGEIDRSWGISSYSSLISGETREPETSGDDSTETWVETEPLVPTEGIHAFPRGTRAGICLHKIFETIDFADRASVSEIVRQKLAQFRISDFDEVVTGTIECVLTAPLPGQGFALAEVSKRLHEVEFTFPIDGLTPARLQELFGEESGILPGKIGRLQFHPRRGFMKGFIDLVFQRGEKFYFADWKSNWLGPDASFYDAEHLAAAMAGNFYALQLNIYTVALDRYLRGRVPGYQYEQNFGGAFYIFVRGIDNASRGVVHHRPAHSFIRELDRIFRGNA